MWEEQGRASSWPLEALPVWATCHVPGFVAHPPGAPGISGSRVRKAMG